MEKGYPNKPIELTDATFDGTIKKYPLIMVDCWTAWCLPCRMLEPIVKSLAGKYAGKIVFGKINVDENKKIAMKYSIMSIPTLLVFKNRKNIDRIIGAMPETVLESRIKQYL